jgi:protease-4
LLADAHGDMAKLALSSKLVDGLKTRDEVREMMIARGAMDEKSHSFRQISFEDYLAKQRPQLIGDAIGVVVASGEISDGTAAPGSIGGLSTANLIRMAREDEHVKAVVLRVDSPGGSAFGAELVRHELELTRAAGKPVVVSMGDVAASGGYWISMAADEVIADPATITGSIGVFALLPTADKAMDKVGVHSAGVTTTWLRDGYDPFRPLDPRFRDLIQATVAHIYDEFTSKAAAARKTTPEKIDAVAQGRVWTGQQAKERGLIDTVGGYGDALKSAAKRAHLGDDYRITYIERELSGIDRIVRYFDVKAAQMLAEHVDLTMMRSGIPPMAARSVANDFGWLSGIVENHRPFTAITHCFCRQP